MSPTAMTALLESTLAEARKEAEAALVILEGKIRFGRDTQAAMATSRYLDGVADGIESALSRIATADADRRYARCNGIEAAAPLDFADQLAAALADEDAVLSIPAAAGSVA